MQAVHLCSQWSTNEDAVLERAPQKLWAGMAMEEVDVAKEGEFVVLLWLTSKRCRSVNLFLPVCGSDYVAAAERVDSRLKGVPAMSGTKGRICLRGRLPSRCRQEAWSGKRGERGGRSDGWSTVDCLLRADTPMYLLEMHPHVCQGDKQGTDGKTERRPGYRRSRQTRHCQHWKHSLKKPARLV